MFSKQALLFSLISLLTVFENASASSLPLTRRATFSGGAGCNTGRPDNYHTALNNCFNLALAGSNFALTGDAKYMRAYFGKDDAASRKAVSNSLLTIALDCSTAAASMNIDSNQRSATPPALKGVTPTNTVFHCVPPAGDSCHKQSNLEYYAHPGNAYVCDIFYLTSAKPAHCNLYSQPNILIMTGAIAAGLNSGSDKTKNSWQLGWFAQGVSLKCLNLPVGQQGLGVLPGWK